MRVDRETLAAIPPEEVYIVDRTQHSPYLPVQFYRLMIPDIPVTRAELLIGGGGSVVG